MNHLKYVAARQALFSAQIEQQPVLGIQLFQAQLVQIVEDPGCGQPLDRCDPVGQPQQDAVFHHLVDSC